VAILNLASAFDDDVGVRLEQADDLLVGGDRLAMENATFGRVSSEGWRVQQEKGLPG